MFFAGDLLLFGVDRFDTFQAMIDVLNNFCTMSNQSITFLNPKCSYLLRFREEELTRLSTIMGIQLTQNLGKYLGISLLHSRVSESHFNSTVERVQSKLTVWVNDALNLAGHTTMIQSVTSTIASYAKQTLEFPIGVCVIIKLHRINKRHGE